MAAQIATRSVRREVRATAGAAPALVARVRSAICASENGMFTASTFHGKRAGSTAADSVSGPASGDITARVDCPGERLNPRVETRPR